MIILDPDGEVVVDVNDRACEVYGRSREAFLGISMRELSENVEFGIKQTAATSSSRGVHRFGTRQYRGDGSVMILDVHAAPIEIDGCTLILSVHRDVTDATILRDKIASAAHEWQMTVDGMDRPLFVMNSDGFIIRVNRKAKEFALEHGYGEIVGKHALKISRREAWLRIFDLANIVLSTRSPASAQITDEKSGWTWDVTATLALHEDREPLVVILARNITDEIELEQQLRRNERMAEMGHLVGGVAHEVRNPLFIISASFEALEARVQTLDDVSRAHLRNLRDQIARLSGLMNDLLEYAKPPILNISIGPLRDVVEEAVAMVEQSVQHDGIVLRCDVPAHLQVLMDRERLARAFENLLKNAIQHTPPDGAVIVQAGLRSATERDWIWCTVDDTGTGFQDGDVADIFEPFITHRTGGTGLGLSIVKRTIEIHGGRITARSAETGGARFKIELPAAQNG